MPGEWLGGFPLVEEGVVHGDVPVGRLRSGLCRDLGEPFLAGREGGPRVVEDAVERLQGRGGQPEDCASGGGDGGGGEDGSVRDVAVGDASCRAADWAARSCVERGKVNRARDRSSVGVSGGCGSSRCAREWWAAM